MSENHEKYSETEIDPLTDFMFGRSRQRDWLFGARRNEIEEIEESNDAPETASMFNNQMLNNINIVELMDQIDILVKSASELKPLYKKVTPIINSFIKNK